MGMLQQMGMKQVIENSERLNRYMKSIDDDLKALQEAFNNNITLLYNEVKGLSEKIEMVLNYGKKQR